MIPRAPQGAIPRPPGSVSRVAFGRCVARSASGDPAGRSPDGALQRDAAVRVPIVYAVHRSLRGAFRLLTVLGSPREHRLRRRYSLDAHPRCVRYRRPAHRGHRHHPPSLPSRCSGSHLHVPGKPGFRSRPLPPVARGVSCAARGTPTTRLRCASGLRGRLPVLALHGPGCGPRASPTQASREAGPGFRPGQLPRAAYRRRSPHTGVRRALHRERFRGSRLRLRFHHADDRTTPHGSRVLTGGCARGHQPARRHARQCASTAR